METLHFDLQENATRFSLESQLRMAFDTYADDLSVDAYDIDAAVQNAGIENKNYCSLAEINEAIDGFVGVSDRVCEDMRAIYLVLAEAEAAVHGVSVDKARFHEIGRAGGIRNALRICMMIEALDPEVITATRVQTGYGRVQCEYGLLDIPAPATAAILARGVPTCIDRLEGERCTPTSASIIFHFVEEFIW